MRGDGTEAVGLRTAILPACCDCNGIPRPQGRGCVKIKYLKLSSFWKEESPKGEVVGKKIQNIDIQTIVKTYHPA